MRRCFLLCLSVLALAVLLNGCVTLEKQAPEGGAAYEDEWFEPLSAFRVPDYVTVVGFGEATHGNHDFKALGAEVFKALVLEQGFRAFGLEAHFGNCVAINDYVLYGKGTAKEAVGGNGFWVHNFQEVVDLVEWMRAYNITAEEGDKLRFYGFDIQETAVSAGLFLEFIQKVDADKAELYKNAYGSMLSTMAYGADAAILENLLREVDAIIAETEENRERYILAASRLEYEYALRNVLCVRYTIENALLLGTGDVDTTKSRDARMAENVRWIVEMEESLGHGKVFLFAHNWHIREFYYTPNTTMGQQLSVIYGDNYYTLGTTYYKNSFLAIDRSRGLVENTVSNDLAVTNPNSLTKMFVDANIDVGILDISKCIAAGGKMEELVTRNQVMGMIGAVYDSTYSAINIIEQLVPADTYDAIIFVRNATPATFIK